MGRNGRGSSRAVTGFQVEASAPEKLKRPRTRNPSAAEAVVAPAQHDAAKTPPLPPREIYICIAEICF